MNVLSLFDGTAAGKLALERSGIKVSNYFSSEIDPYAIKVANENHPDIIPLGSITEYKKWDLPKIDLIIGGSPCQDLSRIKSKEGKGLLGEKSKLFFKYLESINKFKPDQFMLENVIMNQESNDIISASLGVAAERINSSHFSAQDRDRLYWTNIQFDKKLPDNNLVFADVMESDVDEKYFYDDEFELVNGPGHRMYGSLQRRYPNGKIKFTETTARVYNPEYKMATLTAVSGGHQEKKVRDNGRTRKLTPFEYERLQNLPDGYTASVSNSQRYKMCGNGWTVNAVAHIFKGLK